MVTQFFANPVTVPILLFSRTPHVPPRATCPAQPHFMLHSTTAPHAQRWSGVPCTASQTSRHLKDQWRGIPNDSIFISPQWCVREQQRCCTRGARGVLQTSQEKETLVSRRRSCQVRTAPLDTLCHFTRSDISDLARFSAVHWNNGESGGMCW